MKKYVIYSLILHVALIALALFIAQEKKEGGAPPFYARIITPDELKEGDRPGGRSLPKGVAPRKGAKKSSAARRNEEADTKGMKLPGKTGPGKSLQKESPSVRPQIPEAGGGGEQKGVERFRGHESTSPAPSKPLKEKLFDKDIIGKLAQKEKEGKKPDSAITFDTKEFQYYGYLQRLKEKIEHIWKYPSEAAERGLYGDLYIRFTIKKDGKLGAVELVRTSGHKSLDDAAIKALKDAEPYWPIPDELEKDGFTITGHFVYSIYGTYIR
ncbi:MAG: energy transducer TonB [Nitrospirae bacterium]|nr:energy transducer TonB [Nitrospirota bacterium]